MGLTPREKIIKAKIKIYQNKAFYARLMSEMEFKIDNKQPSAYINPIKMVIGYNEDFIDKLNDEEVQGLIIHEIRHFIKHHTARLNGRDAHIANVCQDLNINDELKNLEHMQLPKCGLIPDYNGDFKVNNQTFNVRGKIYEKIYEELYPTCKPNPKMMGSGFDEAPQGMEDLEKMNPEQRKAHETKVKNTIIQASILGKNKGQLPQDMERMIDALMNPKIDYVEKLRNYLIDSIPNDYTWARLNKRSESVGLFLPGKKKDELLDVVSTLDTSGSMDKEAITRGITESIAVSQSFPQVRNRLIICDSEIKDVYELTQDNAIEIINKSIKGGGGTSHVPVYEWLEKHSEGIKVVINYTDGYTEFPEKHNYPFDTIWVLTRNHCDPKTIPFGEVILVEDY